MHISDGVLPVQVWAAGWGLTAGAVVLASRRFDSREVPRIAVVTSLFFIVSLVQIPLGFTSVHLLLTGLIGIVLGRSSYSGMLVALFLQYILLGVGGLSTLGVNAFVLGSGAVASRFAFVLLAGGGSSARRFALAAFAATILGVAVTGTLFFLALALGGRELAHVGAAVVAYHVPVGVLDGIVAASAVLFLRKVEPGLLALSSRTLTLPSVPLAPSVLAFVLVSALGSNGLLAHGVEAFATVEADGVRVEAFFSSGTPFRGARVIVCEAASPGDSGPRAEVARGVTDEEGRYSFEPRRAVDHLVVIEDDGGHRKEFRIPGTKLVGRNSGSSPQEGADPTIGSTRGEGFFASWPLLARVALGLAAIALLALLLRFVLPGRRGPRAP